MFAASSARFIIIVRPDILNLIFVVFSIIDNTSSNDWSRFTTPGKRMITKLRRFVNKLHIIPPG